MKRITSALAALAFVAACGAAGADQNGAQDTTTAADTLAPDTTVVHASASADTGRSDTLTLALVGDIMPGTTYPTRQLASGDGTQLFRDVDSLLRTADITAGNLEGALCDTGQTAKRGAHVYAFRIPTAYGQLLARTGFDLLSVANNHSADFGEAGIRTTEQTLRACGIAFAGIEGRSETCIIERAGRRIGFCAFGHNRRTVKHTDEATVRRIVTDLRRRCDLLVVSFHGGAEGTKYRHLPDGPEMFLGEQRGNLRRLAHLCVDLGADVVYGHGPHITRCVELYKGRFIAYSLGNFCTPYGINVAGISGYAPVVRIRVDGRGAFVDGRIHSFIQQRGRGPLLDRFNAVAREMKALTEADIPGTALVVEGDGTLRRK